MKRLDREMVHSKDHGTPCFKNVWLSEPRVPRSWMQRYPIYDDCHPHDKMTFIRLTRIMMNMLRKSKKAVSI